MNKPAKWLIWLIPELLRYDLIGNESISKKCVFMSVFYDVLMVVFV